MRSPSPTLEATTAFLSLDPWIRANTALLPPEIDSGQDCTEFPLETVGRKFSGSRRVAIEALKERGPVRAVVLPKVRAVRREADADVRKKADEAPEVIEMRDDR